MFNRDREATVPEARTTTHNASPIGIGAGSNELPGGVPRRMSTAEMAKVCLVRVRVKVRVGVRIKVKVRVRVRVRVWVRVRA